jgi:AcrR family transcriptional regulator
MMLREAQAGVTCKAPGMVATPQRTPRLAPEVRRAQLLDAALDVLSERGFDAVTVEAVAQRAGVTRPVIYDLFGDLEGLMLALLDREEDTAMAPLLAIVGGEPGDEVDPETFLVDAVFAFLRAVKSNPRTWRLVLMPPRGSSRELRERIRASRQLLARRITGLLDWGIERRGGPRGLDHELLARMIVAAGEDAARLMLSHPRRFSPERMAAMTRDLLTLLPPALRAHGNRVPELLAPDAGGAFSRTSQAGPAPASVRRVPRAQRREQLLDVTLALLSEEGFDALSMEAVARRAGVNRVVVYRSFANLQLLLIALLRREDRRIRDVLDAVLPASPGAGVPARVLGEALARFLAAVVAQPQTWRVALLRPESAPTALQKLVNRRRAQIAQRLEPLVSWGMAALPSAPASFDTEILGRMLLSIAEEQGRLALDDPDFPPRRLMASSWALLDAF